MFLSPCLSLSSHLLIDQQYSRIFSPLSISPLFSSIHPRLTSLYPSLPFSVPVSILLYILMYPSLYILPLKPLHPHSLLISPYMSISLIAIPHITILLTYSSLSTHISLRSLLSDRVSSLTPSLSLSHSLSSNITKLLLPYNLIYR